MKPTHMASITLLGAALTSGAWGQSEPSPALEEAGAELDIIMTVVDENDTPDDVVNRIPLPPPEPAVRLPDVDPAEPPLDAVERATNEMVEDTSRIVTETINDALSSGNLDEIDLPEDIDDSLPDEAIDDLLDEATDGVDDVVDDVNGTVDDATALDDLEAGVSRDSIDDAVDDLESSLERVDDVQSAVDELGGPSETTTPALDELKDSLNDSAVDEVLDGAEGTLN